MGHPRLFALTASTVDGRDRAALGLRAYGETQAADNLPVECPYTIEEILRRGWYPEPPGEKP